VKVYKICKPYVQLPLEPYLLAVSIYTVSKDKAHKLYNLLYKHPAKETWNEVAVCMGIAKALQENLCEQFFSYVSEARHG
jgi:hypothetical protein